jgi:ParB family chromosome partitioning protein
MSKRSSLADLLGETDNDEATPVEGAGRIALDLLAANPDNPRGAVDTADPDFAGLQASIESIGVVQALTVCTRRAFLEHHPQHADRITEDYVVVAGHRRLEAARRAGVADVPVTVDDAAAENPLVWAVAENLQRVGLNPVQEARALRVLTDKPPAGRGMSQGVVARGIGKTQPFVSGRIALLKLALELQDLVAARELKVKRGALLSKLPETEQLAAEQQLRKLVPELQSEIDGGRLTDVRLALRLAGLPEGEQIRARRTGLPDVDSEASEADAGPDGAIPKQPRSAASGDNSVIGGGSVASGSVRTPPADGDGGSGAESADGPLAQLHVGLEYLAAARDVLTRETVRAARESNPDEAEDVINILQAEVMRIGRIIAGG